MIEINCRSGHVVATWNRGQRCARSVSVLESGILESRNQSGGSALRDLWDRQSASRLSAGTRGHGRFAPAAIPRNEGGGGVP